MSQTCFLYSFNKEAEAKIQCMYFLYFRIETQTSFYTFPYGAPNMCSIYFPYGASNLTCFLCIFHMGSHIYFPYTCTCKCIVSCFLQCCINASKKNLNFLTQHLDNKFNYKIIDSNWKMVVVLPFFIICDIKG